MILLEFLRRLNSGVQQLLFNGSHGINGATRSMETLTSCFVQGGSRSGSWRIKNEEVDPFTGRAVPALKGRSMSRKPAETVEIRLAEPSLPGSLPRRANCGKSGVSRCHDQPRRSPALQRPSAHAN